MKDNFYINTEFFYYCRTASFYLKGRVRILKISRKKRVLNGIGDIQAGNFHANFYCPLNKEVKFSRVVLALLRWLPIRFD